MANSSLSKWKRLRAEAQALLSEEETLRAEQEAARGRKFAYFVARAFWSFSRNRGPVRAAALAYTTVLALVPMLAVAVSVTTGLLKTDKGEQEIRRIVYYFAEKIAAPLGARPAGDDVASSRETAVGQIMTWIRNVDSNTLGVTGLLVFVFLAISLLSTIEETFNDMWGVERGRSWTSRIISYWAALTLGPILLMLAFALNTASQVEAVKEWLGNVPGMSALVKFLLPTVLFSMTFSALYLVMPNTKVDWRAALVGGAFAGVLLQLTSFLSVFYTSRVVNYHKVYGGLSMVPLFLLGLYLMWLIVLFGAQVAYAYQNRKAYSQDKQAEQLNQRGREFVALRLMTAVGQKFRAGETPLSAAQLADELGVPVKAICQLTALLQGAGLIIEVAGAQNAYAPGRPLNRITADDVLQALRTGGGQEWGAATGAARPLVRQCYERIEQAERDVAASVTIEDLVGQIEGEAKRG